jgi:hypothetical protein
MGDLPEQFGVRRGAGFGQGGVPTRQARFPEHRVEAFVDQPVNQLQPEPDRAPVRGTLIGGVVRLTGVASSRGQIVWLLAATWRLRVTGPGQQLRGHLGTPPSPLLRLLPVRSTSIDTAAARNWALGRRPVRQRAGIWMDDAGTGPAETAETRGNGPMPTYVFIYHQPAGWVPGTNSAARAAWAGFFAGIGDRIVDPAQPVLDRATLGEVGAATQLAGRRGQPRGGGHAGQGVPGIQAAVVSRLASSASQRVSGSADLRVLEDTVKRDQRVFDAQARSGDSRCHRPRGPSRSQPSGASSRAPGPNG